MDIATSAMIGGLNIAGDAGIPGTGTAAGALSEIRKCCEQIHANKQACRRLSNKVAELADTITMLSAAGVPDASLRDLLSEFDLKLFGIYHRVNAWSQYSKLKALLKRNEIGEGVTNCTAELDVMMSKFLVVSALRHGDAQALGMQQMEAGHEEIRERIQEVLQVLRDRSSLQEAANLQRHGEPAAEMLMREGQQLLAEGRGDADDPVSLEEYGEFRKGLAHLQQLTDILPSIKLLNGEISRIGDRAVEIGGHSQIWKGVWLDEIPVALKCLQEVRVSARAQKRFIHEIEIWSKLKNPHVQPLFGIVTNLGPLVHVVSPWRSEGNLSEYAGRVRSANKIYLLWGAAGGLAYLHDKDIVHGNVRCSNILVSSKGEALLCDFGMAKVVGDINSTPATTTLTRSGSTRWLAPELIFEDTVQITTACDVWSFGMTMLELFTMREPWAEKRRDAHVIAAMTNGALPSRPQNIPELTDSVWGLMSECWDRNPDARPAMSIVPTRIATG
ncbi:kinase-like domain-containing protein [Rhodofomes roseus]|uniref:Kinase-like domain-containing protein n=1 Tax=Rhodofomes roseus TaxID=34475 RepID=A0ABQ8KV34_9APHY|nr:kinase-like domain-containing protein [Rhodofomes roseus]KAH9842886.1 kinase-like domain-containing protein [Rhodofomes roseus]